MIAGRSPAPALAGDAVETRGLLVEPFSTGTRTLVAAELASAPGVSNPVDTAGTGEKDIETFARVTRILTAAADVDSVLLTGYFGGYRKYSAGLGDAELRVARELADIATGAAKAFVAHLMFDTSPAARVLREGGVAVYRYVETAAWVGSTLPFSELGQAHARMGRGEDVFGNVAVLVGAGGPGLGRQQAQGRRITVESPSRV